MSDKKMIVFDMDGTIADLYGVRGWLKDLQNESVRPYEKAKPLYNMFALNVIIRQLQEQGWRIAVTSWLAKGDHNKRYFDQIRAAKLEWLAKYDFPYDEIHLVKYGTTKANCTRLYGGFQILVDDVENIRKGWTLGATIDANKNILPALKGLLFINF